MKTFSQSAVSTRATDLSPAMIPKLPANFGAAASPPFELLTQIRGDNPHLVRDQNRNLILNSIRMRPISRIGLSRSTGLQPSTITSHVDQLIREELVREFQAVPSPRGRHPTLLSFNDRLGFLVADITASRASVAAMDMRGALLHFSHLPAGGNIENLVQTVGRQMSAMRRELADYSFKGVGVSLPGRVNTKTRQLAWDPMLEWSPFDVEGYLTKELGLGVELVQVANAALLTELWFGKQADLTNAVLISVTEELSIAAVIKGQIVLGHQGMAGGLGHTPHLQDGHKCDCGRRGCLKAYASTTAALRTYRELSGTVQRKTLDKLLDGLAKKESAALETVRQQAIALANALRTITAILDPEVVFFSGDLSGYWEHVRPIFERELRSNMGTNSELRIECAGDGVFSRLRGAGAAILQRNSGCYLPTIQ